MKNKIQSIRSSESKRYKMERKEVASQQNDSLLPLNIIMEIFSFITKDYKDLAQLRLISKEVRNTLYTMIGGSTTLRCCNSENTTSFFDALVAIDEYEAIGTHYEFSSLFNMFPGFDMVGLTFVAQTNEKIPIQKSGTNDNFHQICHQMCNTKSLSEFKELAKDAYKKGMFLPVSSSSSKYGDYSLVIVSLEPQGHFSKLKSFVRMEGQTVFLRVMDASSLKLMKEGSPTHEDQGFLPRMEDAGLEFRGYISDSNQDKSKIWVPMCIHKVDEDMYEEWRRECPQTMVEITEIMNTHQLKPVKEGVAIADGIVHTELHNKLIQQINQLSKVQDLDYHPHSNDMVRDLVHPALYSYVKGVSKVLDKKDLPPCEFPANATPVVRPPNTDYWGRKYEISAKYQWLPTYFEIGADGSCTICDYINNLVPRENYSDLYDSLQELFELALPLLESVYSYGRNLQRHLLNFDEDGLYQDDDYDLQLSNEEYCSLKGKKVQVITKIVDYELGPGDTYEGVWHVEGMSHEDIVATSIYILERDEDIVGGNLFFKRAFHMGEASFLLSNIVQDRERAQDDVVDNGLVPLGQAETKPKRLIAFPNCHVHKVSTIKFEGKSNPSARKGPKQKRRIVVFFLINPEKRIISTREVPPQQMHAGGNMTREDACEHRLKLMRERKYTKQDWNVREIELCEH